MPSFLKFLKCVSAEKCSEPCLTYRKYFINVNTVSFCTYHNASPVTSRLTFFTAEEELKYTCLKFDGRILEFYNFPQPFAGNLLVLILVEVLKATYLYGSFQSTHFRFYRTLFMLPSCLVAKSFPTLCDPMDCSPSGSSVHGIFPG